MFCVIACVANFFLIMSDFPSIGCHYPLSRKIRVYDPSPLYYCKRGAVCRSAVFRNKREKLGKLSVASRPFTSPIWDMIICDSTKREQKSLSLSAASPLIIESSSFSAGGPSNEQDIPFFFFPLVIRETEFDFHFFFKKNPPRHPKYVVRLRTYVRMNTSIIIFDQITPFFP